MPRKNKHKSNKGTKYKCLAEIKNKYNKKFDIY